MKTRGCFYTHKGGYTLGLDFGFEDGRMIEARMRKRFELNAA